MYYVVPSVDLGCDPWLTGRGILEIRLEKLIHASSSHHASGVGSFAINTLTFMCTCGSSGPWLWLPESPIPWLLWLSSDVHTLTYSVNRQRQTVGQSPGVCSWSVNRSARGGTGAPTGDETNWLSWGGRGKGWDIRLIWMPVKCPSYRAILRDNVFGMRLFRHSWVDRKIIPKPKHEG